jgi:hypothetical protein
MRRHSGEESASADSLEVAIGESSCGAHAEQAETSHGDRMLWPTDGLEHVMAKTIPTRKQGAIEATVSDCIRP